MTQNALNLIGRLALAALFLPAGIGKITAFEGTVGYIASVGLPMATLGALLAVVIETVGGVALIVGFKTRIVALVLAAHGAGRFSLDGRRGN
jgi:putative oxidoreductase